MHHGRVKMRLFYVPKTRATRPRWVLEELGVPYELVRLDVSKGETRGPTHLERHPQGHVPVLEDGGARIFESAAICLHLADRFPDKGLAPPLGTPERALLYQWLFFAVTELEPPLSALSAQRRKPEPERDAALMEAARAQFAGAARALEPALGTSGWLVGGAFTVADVLVGSMLVWAKAMGACQDLPSLDAYVTRLRERPAWQRATAD
jgi:glutathione S-transferase